MWELILYNDNMEIVGYFLTKTVESCQNLSMYIFSYIDTLATYSVCSLIS